MADITESILYLANVCNVKEQYQVLIDQNTNRPRLAEMIVVDMFVNGVDFHFFNDNIGKEHCNRVYEYLQSLKRIF